MCRYSYIRTRNISIELFDLYMLGSNFEDFLHMVPSHSSLSQKQLFGFAIFHPSFSACSSIVSFILFVHGYHTRGAYLANINIITDTILLLSIYSLRPLRAFFSFCKRIYINCIRAELYIDTPILIFNDNRTPVQCIILCII